MVIKLSILEQLSIVMRKKETLQTQMIINAMCTEYSSFVCKDNVKFTSIFGYKNAREKKRC